MVAIPKNFFKYLLILFLFAILIIGGFIFWFNKNNNQAGDDSLTPGKSQETNDNAKTGQGIKSAPVLLNDEEKKKYGVNADEPAYLETIEGSNDLIGPLPRLVLPKEELVGPPSEIDINKDSDQDGLTDTDELKKYKTDPKNPDTFSLGMKDGAAVEKGLIEIK